MTPPAFGHPLSEGDVLPHKLIKYHFFHFVTGSSHIFFAGASFSSLCRNETTERQADNEVVKKASTLTANGDPLCRGVVYLGAWLF